MENECSTPKNITPTTRGLSKELPSQSLTPSRKEPHRPGHQMSAGLRERLKKSGRYHSSPVSAVSCSTDLISTTNYPGGDAVVSASNISPNTTPKSLHVRARCGLIGRRSFTPPMAGGCTSSSITNENSPCSSLRLNPLSRDSSLPSENIAKKIKLDESALETDGYGKQLKGLSNDTSLMVKSGSSLVNGGEKVNTSTDSLGSGYNSDFSSQSSTSTGPSQSTSQNIDTVCDTDGKNCQIQKEKAKLLARIEVKTESVRKLNMVKMYRSKNNLTQLQALIDKWRSVSQDALHDLHQLTPQPKPSITALIDYYQLDHKLLHFDSEDESFS